MKNIKKLLKAIVAVCILLYLFCCNSNSPKTGEWSGDGISFTIASDKTIIEELQVMIPLGNDQYHSQVFYDLKIEDGKFSYHFTGNSYLGLPDVNLEGELVSNKLAKGTFNDYDWTAMPK